jgi:stage III sporulation protein AE
MAVISICLSVPVLYAANDVLNLCKDAIESGSALFAGAIPLLTSALALGGGGATGAAASVGMSFSLSFVSGFLSSNLFPIAATLFTASIISSFDMSGGVANVSRGVRNWFNFGIGISSLIIAATFSLQTVIASVQDGIALRSAKYAASSMIPIVGGVVSGALGALLSGVGALTSSLGALSVAALLYICLSPLIMLLAYRLILGACIMMTSFSAASFAKRFFEAIRGALDCVIAVMASSLVLYIANITVFVTVARGIVL